MIGSILFLTTYFIGSIVGSFAISICVFLVSAVILDFIIASLSKILTHPNFLKESVSF